MEKTLIANSKIRGVVIHPNSAVVYRDAEFKCEAGIERVKIESLEPSMIQESLIIKPLGGFEILDYDVLDERIRVDLALGEEYKLKLYRFKAMEYMIKLMDFEIEGLKKLIEHVDKAGELASYRVLQGNGLEDLKKILKIRRKIAKRMIQKMDERKLYNYTMENLERKVPIKDRLVKTKSLIMVVKVKNGGLKKLQLEYQVEGVQWKPTYHIIVGKNVVFRNYAIVRQESGLNWKKFKLIVTTKPIQPVKFYEPEPWIIEERRKIAFRATKPEVGKPAIEVSPTIWGHITYSIENVSLDHGEIKRVPISLKELQQKTVYVWDSFTSPGFVALLELINDDEVILPGEYRAFKSGVLVGMGWLDLVGPNSKFKVPIGKVENIDADRKLVSRVSEKNVLGKVSTEFEYELNAVSHLSEAVKAVIYDRLPVFKNPQVEVKFDGSNLKCELSKLGVISWHVDLKPEVPLKIKYKYTIRHPIDFALPL